MKRFEKVREDLKGYERARASASRRASRAASRGASRGASRRKSEQVRKGMERSEKV